jgi:hypothetical protein
MNTVPHFNFAFRIRYIRAELPPHIPHESVITVGNHFRPPTDHTHFALDETPYVLDGHQYAPNTIFMWGPGTVIHTDYEHLHPYRSTSLFWCSDRGGYLIVPFDCTLKDVYAYPDRYVDPFDSENEDSAGTTSASTSDPYADEIPQSWQRMTYTRDDADAPISRVGYHLEYYRLGARVPNSWNNFLVPPTQSRQNTSSNGNNALQMHHYQPRCALTGDLGALIGLCAFCAPVQSTPETIRTSFRPRLGSAEWVRPDNAIPFHESKSDPRLCSLLRCIFPVLTLTLWFNRK